MRQTPVHRDLPPTVEVEDTWTVARVTEADEAQPVPAKETRRQVAWHVDAKGMIREALRDTPAQGAAAEDLRAVQTTGRVDAESVGEGAARIDPDLPGLHQESRGVVSTLRNQIS